MENGKLKSETPVNILWDNILLLPIFGTVDSKRVQSIMEAILNKISDTGYKNVILDILGVRVVDSAVANHLIKITKATRLMGCECIISGISPEVAQAIVSIGIDLGEVTTTATMRDALSLAFKSSGFKVVKTTTDHRQPQ